jgi:DNA polymerase
MNPSVCAGGVFDSDHVGPWSLWQGTLNADLMLVGQDWGDVAYFVNNRGHESARNPTNEMLRYLLSTIGIPIASPSPTDDGGGPVFFTSAILCLKTGGLQAPVDPAWFANCGSRFLMPTIEIAQPRVVVTLGERAYRAVMGAFGMRPMLFRAAVDREGGIRLPVGITLFPVYHCGARIMNTHRPLAMQVEDWARIGRGLRQRAPKAGA